MATLAMKRAKEIRYQLNINKGDDRRESCIWVEVYAQSDEMKDLFRQVFQENFEDGNLEDYLSDRNTDQDYFSFEVYNPFTTKKEHCHIYFVCKNVGHAVNVTKSATELAIHRISFLWRQDSTDLAASVIRYARLCFW